jgi:DNA-binding NtrC family response regulator
VQSLPDSSARRFHGTNAATGALPKSANYYQNALKGFRHYVDPTEAHVMSVILVVEDDAFIRQAALWMIEDLGHDALFAEDLAGALSHLNATVPIDALFVDIRLDKLAHGGYDVANQAVGIRPGLRILYTSGSPITAAMTDMFVDDGQFLQKPYSAEQLGQSVGRLLQ